MRTRLIFNALLACALLPAQALAQSPITFQYIYDDLNQLTKVIDSTGVVIQYVYDPVGNILQINRSTVQPGALTIFNISPLQAPTGTNVTIQGQGFSINPALDIVTIGGVAVTVVSATATTLVVAIPAGAMSGSIKVTVGGVTTTSPTPETIIPAPIITSVMPRVMQAGTTATVTVTGANFAGTTFSIPGSGIIVSVASATADGTSAVLTLIANATANGRFAVVGSNGAAASGTAVTMANAFSAFIDPSLDPDGDGLPNGLELIFGTDPFNADTDGDGFSDGVEVASRSNPLDPNSTPLNSRISGDAESLPFGISNVGFTLAARAEVDSKPFGVLNTGPTKSTPHEADSKPFSILDILPTKTVPAEAGSFPFSVLNNPVGASFPNEADTIPFSVCNTMLSPAACSDYTSLSVVKVTKLQATGAAPALVATTETHGTRGAQGPADGRPFSVLAIAPADHATRIAPMSPTSPRPPISPVAIAFSAPLDPASITPGNFSLFAGDKALDPEIRYSADFRTVTLNAPLPADASILVQVSDQVQDLWGRRLQAFQSEFHTAAAPRSASLMVIAQRPAAGATAVDSNAAIHLILDKAVDSNRAHNALSITQDGEPIEGRLQITRGGKDIEFVPYAPFHSGAVVKISLDNVDHTDGQLATRYEGLFTTAASFDISEPLRAIPGGVAAPLNSVMEFEYSRPLDRSTVTPATVTLTEDSTSQPSPATAMLRGDHFIRVIPSALLVPGSTYTLEVSGKVQDMTGRGATPIHQSFTVGSEATSGVPRLISTTPVDAATDVDANSEVHLVFGQPINPLTLDSETLRLTQDGAPVAASISLAHHDQPALSEPRPSGNGIYQPSGTTEVIITPLMPLNPSAQLQLTISGVEDLTGNTLLSSTVRFQVRADSRLASPPLRNNEQPVHRPVFAPLRVVEFLIGRR